MNHHLSKILSTEVAVPRDLQVDDCIVVEEDGEADDGLATSSELNKSETPYAINAGHNKSPSEKDPDGDTVNDTLSNINNAGHSVAPSFEDKKGNNVSDVPSGTFRGLLLGLTLVSLLAQTCLIYWLCTNEVDFLPRVDLEEVACQGFVLCLFLGEQLQDVRQHLDQFLHSL